MKSIARFETFEPNTSFPDGARCWIISDGKAGNETQCVGVAEALGVAFETKRVDPKGLSRFLAPYGGVSRRERFGQPHSQFSPPWPDLAIACGRLTTPYIRAVRRAGGLSTYTVVLLDPKTGPNTADLFWVPEHDRRRGGNVITSLTSPHRFSPARLEQLRDAVPADIAALPRPRVAVLVGGPNGDYTYRAEDAERLVALLSGVARGGAGLMVTCSRRTPAALADRVEAATRESPGHVYWNGHGANPYPDFLANAEVFVVTADSVNMVGEACATGRPVHVFFPHGGSAKFDRFHRSLEDYGATRPIADAKQIGETWDYLPLFSATAIAAEITRRVLRRRAVLGNVM